MYTPVSGEPAETIGRARTCFNVDWQKTHDLPRLIFATPLVSAHTAAEIEIDEYAVDACGFGGKAVTGKPWVRGS